jgi:hypothetical protein
VLFAAAQFAPIPIDFVSETDARECVFRALNGFAGMLAAYVQRQANIVQSRERRKQMIGLEHEADMLAP